MSINILLPNVHESEEEEVKSLFEKCWLVFSFPGPSFWFSFDK